ncbi:regulatory protein RecX [Leucobacter denitrificans]|uniref:Regulatory protein RecX n=1 Tax=Leucobacter denitrificans TaxID=683042 RepID=A0A7G9S4Q8_9MICO|nr:regulatory protein RecX [Leucobacter denitrificans]QNN62833.1 regulatory protein RecX [Leucobacter denitrificans]
MAVRFLPSPEDRPRPPREERGDLAEVIEFRTKLQGFRSSEEQEADKEPVPVALELPPVGSEERVARDDAAPVALEQPSAGAAAVKLLARRALSSGELRRALLDAEFPEIDVEEAIAECESSLYLDDTDLARSVTYKLRDSKGESRARIRRKLRERLLPDVAIEAALAELDDEEEYELLQQTASDRARRMVDLDRQVAERRLLGFLARRGWVGERASRAVREALDELGVGWVRGSVRFQ